MKSYRLLPWNLYRLFILGFLKIFKKKNINEENADFLIKPRNRFFSYFVRKINPKLIQSKTPYGTIVQPLDSLEENYAIYHLNTYDEFYEIKNDDVVVDVGAHVGIFTLKAAHKAKQVISVEPFLPNYNLLVYNIKQNHLNNVLFVNVALADFCGKTRLYIYDDSLSHSIQREFVASSFLKNDFTNVKTFTLDKLLETLRLDSVDFIKINVEGAELNVLRGASKTIEQNNLTLAIATNHYPSECEDISKFLKRKNFHVKRYYYDNFIMARKNTST